MAIFARHIKSTVAMAVYGLWWAFLLNWFTSGSANAPRSCGAANGALVMITLLLMAVFGAVLAVFSILSKGQKRKDYLVLLGLLLAPLLYLAM
jgi:hypothetical protein